MLAGVGGPGEAPSYPYARAGSFPDRKAATKNATISLHCRIFLRNKSAGHPARRAFVLKGVHPRLRAREETPRPQPLDEPEEL